MEKVAWSNWIGRIYRERLFTEKDMDAAGESLQVLRSANMTSSNKDVMWIVAEVM
jgi:hypothetical protein